MIYVPGKILNIVAKRRGGLVSGRVAALFVDGRGAAPLPDRARWTSL